MSFWEDAAKYAFPLVYYPTKGLIDAGKDAADKKNPTDRYFDPGGPKRNDAQALDEEARRLWVGNYENDPIAEGTGLYGHIPTVEEQQLSYGYGQDVNPYQAGTELPTFTEDFLTEGEAAAAGLPAYSQWRHAQSAYGGLGPSAYDKMGPSAYEGMDPSAYGDLAFDPNRMGEAQNYFGELTKTGTDPIAEADYARRVAAAEQQRRANMEAALAENEMRGQGNVGDRILSELSGTQAQASDTYQAGLDAAAMAAARRDSAAGSLADVSERIARGELDADTARAAGLDTYARDRASGLDTYARDRAAGLDSYGLERAAGQDRFTTERTSGLDDWAGDRYAEYYGTQERNVAEQNDNREKMWERWNDTSDKNTELQNETNRWNKITAPQNYFDNLNTVTGGATGQYQTSAAGLREEAAAKEKAMQDKFELGADLVKSYYGGGKK